MTLKSDTLADALAELGDPTSPRYPGHGTAVDGPPRLVAAYVRYAEQAVDIAGNPLVSGNEAAMRLALVAALASSAGTAIAAAQAIAAAHTAYWMGAQFSPGKPPPPGTPGVVGGNGIFSVVASSVVTAAPAATLAAQFSALFAAPSTDASSRCRVLAQAWDVATRQVVATLTGLDTTPPPAGPLPIVGVGPIA